MINAATSFILYADCEVTYRGRAKSTLQRGKYLIIRKDDGCLLVHNKNKSIPQNYQAAGATLKVDDNKLISTRKKETIEILLYEVLMHQELKEWSDSEVAVSDTEKDLVNKIRSNWDTIIGVPVINIVAEFVTSNGPIDLVGISKDGCHYIVEVKRGIASLNNASQLNRYYEYFAVNKILAQAMLVSPRISKNALKYLEDHGYKWIQVGFD